MSLADLEKAKHNAAHVLGNAQRRWEIFDLVNGKLSGVEIAKETGIKQPNVASELKFLENQGLIRDTKKSKNPVIYEKVPELRNVNLRGYLRNRKGSTRYIQREEESLVNNNGKDPIIYSQAINKIIEIGKKHGIENIDQNWIDSLSILNFIETSATKFLMEHDYTEEQVKNMKWEQKITKVESKLFEEAKKSNVKLRTTVLTFFKNYRVLRNDVDHHAHLASARTT